MLYMATYAVNLKRCTEFKNAFNSTRSVQINANISPECNLVTNLFLVLLILIVIFELSKFELVL